MDDLRSTRAFEPYVAIIEAAFEVTASLVVIHEGDECAEDPKEERGFRHVQAPVWLYRSWDGSEG